jgi:hypothetical protein
MKIFPSRKNGIRQYALPRFSKVPPPPPFILVTRGETFEESPETIRDPIQQQREDEEEQKLKSIQKPYVMSVKDAQQAFQRIRQQRKASESAKDETKAPNKVFLKLGSLLHRPGNTSKAPVLEDILPDKEDMGESHDPSVTEHTASTVSSNLELSPYDEEEGCFLMTADDCVQLAAPFHDILEDILHSERLMGANGTNSGKKNKSTMNMNNETNSVGSGKTNFHRKMPNLYTSSSNNKNKDEETSPCSQSSIDSVPESKEGKLKKALTSFKNFLCCEGAAGSHGFAATPIDRTPTTCNTITESIENDAECYPENYLGSMESMATYCPDESTISLCAKTLSLSEVIIAPQTKTHFIDDDMVDDVKSQLPPGETRFVEEDMASFHSVTAATKEEQEGSLPSSSIPSGDVVVEQLQHAATTIQTCARDMLARTRDQSVAQQGGPCMDANQIAAAAMSFVPAEIIQTEDLAVAYGRTKDGGDGFNHADAIEIVLLLDEISYTKAVGVDHNERDPTTTTNNRANCPEINIDNRQDSFSSFSTITSSHSVCSQESDLDFQLRMLEDELDGLQSQYKEIIDYSLEVGSKLNDLESAELEDGTMSI